MSNRQVGSQRTPRFSSVAEAQRLARRRLPSWLFDGLTSGNGNLVTSRANLAAFDAVGFAPRAAVSVGEPSLATCVLGRPVALPVFPAPTGYTRMFHPEGDRAVVRATAAVGSIDVVAWDSGRSLEDVASGLDGAGRLWQQLYWVRGREGAAELMERAAQAGYEALVVTIDLGVSPRTEVVLSPRERALPLPTPSMDLVWRYGPGALRHPRWLAAFLRDRTMWEMSKPKVTSGTPKDCLTPSWEDLAWVRDQWKGPLVLKGILTAEDALRAVEVGAEGIVVSNHGGKGLDTQPATMTVLPGIVDAVGDRAEVYLDSGVRTGADVVKALAVGARAVLVGQAYLFGLAVAGEAGVRRILDILAEEARRTMSLIGCESAPALDRSYLLLPHATRASASR